MLRSLVLRYLVIAGILAGIGGGVYWILFHHSDSAGPPGGMRRNGAVAVGVAPAVKRDVPVVLDALGTVTPLAAVTVKTQIAGQLQQVAFTEGQLVKKGDFLAQIDPRPYQAQLEQYQGQLQRDQALLSAAKVDLQRYKVLVEQDSIARQQLDTQSSLVQQYAGIVETDQAQVANARLNVAYCHITAPVTGRVGLRQVDAGNYVQLSDANGLVVITQLHPITVLFTVPEDRVPVLLKRVHSGAVLPVTAFDRAGTNVLATGKVLTVDNQIDITTGTIKVKALFANDDETLFPNQFVNIHLQLDTLADALTVPNAAILHGAPGTFVYVVQEDNKVAVRVVKTGPADALNTAIVDGLSVGERVVVDGSDKLRDGAAVTVAEKGEQKRRDTHE